MSPLLDAAANTETAAVHRFSSVVDLDSGAKTAVHVARYARQEYTPRVVSFEKETCLIDWCEAYGISEALVGGFFWRPSHKALGDVWINGEAQPSEAFVEPYHKVRGSLHIDALGDLAIGPRHLFANKPAGDLLQAGPLLVANGANQITENLDHEGFSIASQQFDSDITIGRHPRAAIGLDDQHIWSIVCDGRRPEDTGLSLAELADVMMSLGATSALNLDGGGSASQVSGGRLRNHARGDGQEYLRGRPIYTAIAFVC